MSKALEGEHYCKDHQGNHSHYDHKNCTVCYLRACLERAEEILRRYRNQHRAGHLTVQAELDADAFLRGD